MYPFFSEKGSVFYEEIDSIELGDILLLRDTTNKEFIVHRVVDSSSNTKGDFSMYLDSPMERIGKVTGFEDPDLGVYIWGKKGHKFKKLFAFYSKATGMRKVARYMAIMEMIIWKKIYFSRHYKSTQDYI